MSDHFQQPLNQQTNTQQSDGIIGRKKIFNNNKNKGGSAPFKNRSVIIEQQHKAIDQTPKKVPNFKQTQTSVTPSKYIFAKMGISHSVFNKNKSKCQQEAKIQKIRSLSTVQAKIISSGKILYPCEKIGPSHVLITDINTSKREPTDKTDLVRYFDKQKQFIAQKQQMIGMVSEQNIKLVKQHRQLQAQKQRVVRSIVKNGGINYKQIKKQNSEQRLQLITAQALLHRLLHRLKGDTENSREVHDILGIIQV